MKIKKNFIIPRRRHEINFGKRKMAGETGRKGQYSFIVVAYSDLIISKYKKTLILARRMKFSEKDRGTNIDSDHFMVTTTVM